MNILNTVKPVYNGPVYSGHPIHHRHRTTSRKLCLMFNYNVDLYIAVTCVYDRRGHPLGFPNPQFLYFLPV